ncbi:NAD-dependent epimerase/dehydratase family protein [Planosporangium sp. 12N6]|uniref:NAD-dependent epimerase/dehydratase family protein n=1 Tax=Planosporangium spinosum TaxID=3402278 RepID=UPI003CF65CE3
MLVTGGLGFLGRAVTLDLLAAGHRVTVLTRGRPDAVPAGGSTAIDGDLRDPARIRDIVAEGGFDAVVHLAALIQPRESFADPLTYYDVNVAGTLNLLRALDEARTSVPAPRLVFASTYLVYGTGRVGTLSEDMPPRPESPYAASKICAEQVIAAYAATGAIGAVTLRCFNVAGAVDGIADTDSTRIIPNVFRALTGEQPYVTLNGDGTTVRDFVHVLDVAEAVRSALTTVTAGEYRVYNVGSGAGTSMAEIVAAAEAVTGRRVEVRKAPARPEPPVLTADTNRIRADLGWRPGRSSLQQIMGDVWSVWPH